MDPGKGFYKILTISAALILSTSVWARDPQVPEASVGLFTAPSLSSATTTGDGPAGDALKSERQLSVGGGALLDGSLSPTLSLGTAVIYEKRKLNISGAGYTAKKSIPTIFIPLEARFWINRYFAVSMGGFAAFRIARVEEEITSTDGTEVNMDGDHEKAELGMTAAALGNIPLDREMGLLLGARYLRGFSNGARSSGYAERIDEIQLMGGLLLTI